MIYSAGQITSKGDSDYRAGQPLAESFGTVAQVRFAIAITAIIAANNICCDATFPLRCSAFLWIPRANTSTSTSSLDSSIDLWMTPKRKNALTAQKFTSACLHSPCIWERITRTVNATFVEKHFPDHGYYRVICELIQVIFETKSLVVNLIILGPLSIDQKHDTIPAGIIPKAGEVFFRH